MPSLVRVARRARPWMLAAAGWIALAAGCDSILGIPDTRLRDAGEADDAAAPDGLAGPSVVESCDEVVLPFVVAPGGMLRETGNTDGARDDADLACGATGTPDHVWRVRVPADAQIRVTIEPAGWMPALGVGTDCAAPGTCSGINPAEVIQSVVANQEVFVHVDGAQTDERGPYNIIFEALPP